MSDLSHIDTTNAVWVDYPPTYELARLLHAATGLTRVRWIVEPINTHTEGRTEVKHGRLTCEVPYRPTVADGEASFRGTPVVHRDGKWALLCEVES